MNEEEKRVMKLIVDGMKRLRKEEDLSQEEFAEKIGVSRDLIAKVETGKRRLTINVITKILIAFNITDIELCGFKNPYKFSINV